MEDNNNDYSFLTVSQVIKNIDNSYTDTNDLTSLYNSNYIANYEI
jgi:hypothetical protein